MDKKEYFNHQFSSLYRLFHSGFDFKFLGACQFLFVYHTDYQAIKESVFNIILI